LRFPGDGVGDLDSFTPARFNAHRKHWHIDGLALKGVNEWFGTIHNFDCLVGILLADVDQPNSGELCVYPGSHIKLSEYFRREGILDILKT